MGADQKMNDTAVKQSLQTLKEKGITYKQIEEVYDYYDRLQINKEVREKIFLGT